MDNNLSSQPLFFGDEGGRPNVECGSCGCQWWRVVVTLTPDDNLDDPSGFHMSGHGSEAVCRQCGVAAHFA